MLGRVKLDRSYGSRRGKLWLDEIRSGVAWNLCDPRESLGRRMDGTGREFLGDRRVRWLQSGRQEPVRVTGSREGGVVNWEPARTGMTIDRRRQSENIEWGWWQRMPIMAEPSVVGEGSR